MTDWPSLLLRLDARGINVRVELCVSRMTVWRWRNGTVPDTEYALRLLALDARTVDGQTANISENVTP